MVKLQTVHANSSSKRIGKHSHKYISDLGFLVLRWKLSSKSFIKVIIADAWKKNSNWILKQLHCVVNSFKKKNSVINLIKSFNSHLSLFVNL